MKQLLLIILFSTAIFGQSGKSVLTRAQKDSIGHIVSDSLAKFWDSTEVKAYVPPLDTSGIKGWISDTSDVVRGEIGDSLDNRTLLGSATNVIPYWNNSSANWTAISTDSLNDLLDIPVSGLTIYNINLIHPYDFADGFVEYTDQAYIIDSIYVGTRDSSIQFNIGYSDTRDGGITYIFTNFQTETNSSGLTKYSLFTNGTIPINKFLRVSVLDVVGITNEELYIKVYYQ